MTTEPGDPLAALAVELGQIKHDLSNPLTVIVGRSQLLLLQAGNEQACRRTAERIAAAAERLAAGVTELEQVVARLREQTAADSTRQGRCDAHVPAAQALDGEREHESHDQREKDVGPRG